MCFYNSNPKKHLILRNTFHSSLFLRLKCAARKPLSKCAVMELFNKGIPYIRPYIITNIGLCLCDVSHSLLTSWYKKRTNSNETLKLMVANIKKKA